MIIVYYISMKKNKKNPAKTLARKKQTKKRTKKEIQSEVSPLSLFVRTRREQLGYTQEELAFRAGLSAGFLKAFERGKKTVRLDKVTDLLNYLGATLTIKERGDHE